MASTLTSTGITFSDGTSLASAAPSAGAVGSYIFGIYNVTPPYPSSSGTRYSNNYVAGTTIAGSSLITNMQTNNTTTPSVAAGPGFPNSINYSPSGRVTGTFFSSGANTGSSGWACNNVFGQMNICFSSNTSYSTQSGSWRVIAGFSVQNYHDAPYNYSNPIWGGSLWIRYA
jgi:hypothetical protein